MWHRIDEVRDDKRFMGMKLFCTVSKIWMCWKLNHETPTETGLIAQGADTGFK
jgi:hypothetical protein